MSATAMVSTQQADAPKAAADRTFEIALLACGLGVFLFGSAVGMARAGIPGSVPLYWAAQTLPFLALAVALVRGRHSRGRTLTLVALVGAVPAVFFHLLDVFLPVGFDEHLHMRTLRDLLAGHGLMHPNPMLEVSPFYPGLETATALVAGLGVPTLAAVLIVVVLSRVVLVWSMFALARTVVASDRAAAIGVLVLACSPQFFAFTSQYSYQTIALPLGLAALAWALHASGSVSPGEARVGVVIAGLCLAAMTISHHLTSWVIVGVLVVLAALAPAGRRRTLAVVAGIGVACVGVWTALLAERLTGYLGPIFDAAATQLVAAVASGDRREVFADAGGYTTPLWEQGVMVAYALLWAFAGIYVAVRLWRRSRERRSWRLSLFALVVLVSPAPLVGRVAPSTLEVMDRASTFLVIALAVGVALLLDREPSVAQTRRERLHADRGWVGIALVAALLIGHLGGIMVGWGPAWNRLPGEYVVGGDYRTADVHTRAGVRWAGEHLPADSRIVADRYPAVMLAGEAGLNPVVEPQRAHGRVYVPANLYFAPEFGSHQWDLVHDLDVSYVWVDTRLADGPPHLGVYVAPGEEHSGPGDGVLSTEQMGKFSGVEGLRSVFTSGPVTIYATGVAPASVDAPSPPVMPWPASLLVGALVALAALRLRARQPEVWLAGSVLLGLLALAVGALPGPAALLGTLVAVLVWIAVGARRDDGRTLPVTRTVTTTAAVTTVVAVVALVLAVAGGGLAAGSAERAGVVTLSDVARAG
ncbi:MAG: hypothetical protein Q4G43_10415 [Mobilicoccus sp.]|nr:hypothetical protein [Mobilicoccus sp.]